MLSSYEKKMSLGFGWTPPEYFHIPPVENEGDALFAWRQKFPEYIGRTLNTLEGIGVTDIDTKIIVEYGKGVSSLSTAHIRAVENFGQACLYLFDMIKNKSWRFNETSLCSLHSILSRDEVQNPGRFRKIPVRIDGCVYTPPSHTDLEKIFTNGHEALITIENIPERAVATFLFLSRSQFFENANKRTAALAMTGTLISNGYYPLNMDKQPKEFLERMADFYDSADATGVFELFNEMGREQYPDFTPPIYDGCI